MSDKEEAKAFSKWSSLPVDLAHLILSKLSFFSMLNFKSTCSSWRNAAKAFIPRSWNSTNPIHQAPLLMLPSQPEEDSSVCFYSLEDNRIAKPINTFRELRDGLCIGSSNGWLVMVGQALDLYLFNPFSHAKIRLPGLETHPSIVRVDVSEKGGYTLKYLAMPGNPEPCVRRVDHIRDLRWFFLSKAVCSPRSDHEDFVVLMILEINDFDYNGELAFCHSGDSSWMRFPVDDYPFSYIDIACYSDCFFALNECGFNIEIWDIIDPVPVKKTVISYLLPWETMGVDPKIWASCSQKLYVVDFRGKPLLVVRVIADNSLNYTLLKDSFPEYATIEGDESYKTILFHMYRHENDENWVQVETLDDCVLFLGTNQTTYFSTADLPLLQPNSIYFTDERVVTIPNKKRHDIGVFKMEDGSTRPHYLYDSWGREPRPLWIVPHL